MPCPRLCVGMRGAMPTQSRGHGTPRHPAPPGEPTSHYCFAFGFTGVVAVGGAFRSMITGGGPFPFFSFTNTL